MGVGIPRQYMWQDHFGELEVRILAGTHQGEKKGQRTRWEHIWWMGIQDWKDCCYCMAVVVSRELVDVSFEVEA